MNVLIVVALMAVAGVLGLVVRRIADLKAQLAHVASEQEIQHSIDRRYVGVDLIEGQVLPLLKQPALTVGTEIPAIDAGTFDYA